MKPIEKLVVIVLTSIGVGGAAMDGPRAQPKLPAYSIVEVEVIDPEGFRAFAKRNADNLASAGAQFLVRNGRVVTSEGAPSKTVFVIAWDSLDQAVSYFSSPGFKELIPLRDKSAKVRLFHVEGLAK